VLDRKDIGYGAAIVLRVRLRSSIPAERDHLGFIDGLANQRARGRSGSGLRQQGWNGQGECQNADRGRREGRLSEFSAASSARIRARG